MKVDNFRKRFLGWAKPRGLEVPTNSTSLYDWVEQYMLTTGDTEGAREYMRRECSGSQDPRHNSTQEQQQ